jgi:hypothetical protein
MARRRRFEAAPAAAAGQAAGYQQQADLRWRKGSSALWVTGKISAAFHWLCKTLAATPILT